METDICIYGGTSAGVIAAVAAKRMGKSVLLIEPGKHLGGMTAGGLGQTDIGNKHAITGLSRDFYKRIGQHYGQGEQWIFEPHVAEKVYGDYVREEQIEVLFEHRIVSAKKDGAQVERIVLEDAAKKTDPQTVIKAKVFIDCSYEGDLMARTGISYAIGRESNAVYNETYNGVQMREKHQFPDGVDPYKTKGDSASGLIWGVSAAQLQDAGSGDENIQAYNFRICLTDSAENRISLSRPENYDSTKYELLARLIAAQADGSYRPGYYVPGDDDENSLDRYFHLQDMPNRKTDINNNGAFSTDMIGWSSDYPEASYDTRAEIIKEHEDYTKGFLYFLANDARVPENIRTEMQKWGYPKDEFVDNGNFSHQLYVREARRMIGEYVMTQANCTGETTVSDAVGMAAYTMDSHNCQRLVVDGMVKNEGDVQIGGFPPYPISYRALTPKREEAENVLVPVCLSASHIAFGSIRMEPVFMVLGQSAAMAASLAIDRNSSVQEIDVEKLQKILANDPILTEQK